MVLVRTVFWLEQEGQILCYGVTGKGQVICLKIPIKGTYLVDFGEKVNQWHYTTLRVLLKPESILESAYGADGLIVTNPTLDLTRLRGRYWQQIYHDPFGSLQSFFQRTGVRPYGLINVRSTFQRSTCLTLLEGKLEPVEKPDRIFSSSLPGLIDARVASYLSDQKPWPIKTRVDHSVNISSQLGPVAFAVFPLVGRIPTSCRLLVDQMVYTVLSDQETVINFLQERGIYRLVTYLDYDCPLENISIVDAYRRWYPHVKINFGNCQDLSLLRKLYFDIVKLLEKAANCYCLTLPDLLKFKGPDLISRLLYRLDPLSIIEGALVDQQFFVDLFYLNKLGPADLL